MKLTKRKGFNFMRSYKDTYELMQTDKDKADFMRLIIDKQFYGMEPDFKTVSPFVQLAYTGQKHSLDKSVKGYEDKTRTKLFVPLEAPFEGNSKPLVDSFEQEQEKEQEKEQVQDVEIHPFEDFWNSYGKKINRPKCLAKWNRLKDSDKEKIKSTLKKYVNSTSDVQFRKNPLTYLNNQSWDDDVIVQDSEKDPLAHLKSDSGNGKLDPDKYMAAHFAHLNGLKEEFPHDPNY